MILNPPEEFKEAILTHFYLKKDIIKRDLKVMVEEA